MPQRMNLSPFVVLTMMYTFAFSMKDEEDEDYEPKVEVRRILTNIPKFPDISAFGPKSIGALKLLNDWIDDDVGEWLVTHEKGEFLEEDSGIPITALDHGDAKVKSEAGADGAGEVDEEEAEGEGAGSMSPAAKSTVSYFTKRGKRMQKIADRKMENFRASQATFFAEIKAAVKHNPDVYAEVLAVPKCDDRGSKAIIAIRKHIMQGQDMGSAEKDSEKYFNKCAESFNLKYPVGATEPIDVKKELVNDHLSKALFELEQHVNDFRKKFQKFPAKHWAKYVPEQNLIGIIRDLLPETPEWRQVRIMIIQGQPNGDDFDKALGLVRFMISEFTSKAAKVAAE